MIPINCIIALLLVAGNPNIQPEHAEQMHDQIPLARAEVYSGGYTNNSPTGSAQNSRDYRIYQSGYEAVMAGNWEEAIARFEVLTDSLPDSQMAPNASYWTCYAREQLGAPPDSSYACYNRVAGMYPDNRWAREALARSAALVRDGHHAPGFPEAVKQLDKGEELVRISILRALHDREDFENWPVLTDVYRQSDSRQIRSEVLVLLSTIPDPAVSDSVYALVVAETNVQLFSTGVRVLSEIHRRHARSEVSGASERAERRLARQLRDLYHARTETEMRSAVVREIATAQIPEMTDLLITASQEDPQYARFALAGLSRAGDEGREQLYMIVSDDSYASQLRIEAIGWLQRVVHKNTALETRFKGLLRELTLTDPNRGVALQALNAYLMYASLDDALVLYENAEYQEAKMRIIGYLPRLADEPENIPLPVITSLLEKADETQLKVQLIRLLHRNNRPDVIRFLLETAREHPDYQVRQAAVTVLGTISNPAATKALEELVKDEDGN